MRRFVLKGLTVLYVLVAVSLGLIFLPGLVVMKLVMPGYQSRTAVVYSGTVFQRGMKKEEGLPSPDRSDDGRGEGGGA